MLTRRTLLLALGLMPVAFAMPAEKLPRPDEAIIKVIDKHQKLVKRGDIIEVQRAWLESVQRWQALTQSQQELVEKERPGTRRWMESGSDYEGDFCEPP